MANNKEELSLLSLNATDKNRKIFCYFVLVREFGSFELSEWEPRRAEKWPGLDKGLNLLSISPRSVTRSDRAHCSLVMTLLSSPLSLTFQTTHSACNCSRAFVSFLAFKRGYTKATAVKKNHLLRVTNLFEWRSRSMSSVSSAVKTIKLRIHKLPLHNYKINYKAVSIYRMM